MHRKFADPSSDRFRKLLKDAGYWKNHFSYILQDIYINCDTCLKTPSRPSICLPLTSNLNDVVAMDLKAWKNGLYIFYEIDVFTRLTKAESIRDKYHQQLLTK